MMFCRLVWEGVFFPHHSWTFFSFDLFQVKWKQSCFTPTAVLTHMTL